MQREKSRDILYLFAYNRVNFLTSDGVRSEKISLSAYFFLRVLRTSLTSLIILSSSGLNDLNSQSFVKNLGTIVRKISAMMIMILFIVLSPFNFLAYLYYTLLSLACQYLSCTSLFFFVSGRRGLKPSPSSSSVLR